MTENLSNKLEAFVDLPASQTKTELLERMAVAYEAAESFIAAHDEAALTKPLGESGWSAKDYLAHLTVWEGSMVALLQKHDRLKSMGLDQETTDLADFDKMNDTLYHLHKDRHLDDVLNSFRQTHHQLLALLGNLNDEDLHKPYKHYQPNEDGDYTANPIMGWLVGDTYSHYAEHILDLGRLLNNP